MLILLLVCIVAYLGLRFVNQNQSKKEAQEKAAGEIVVTAIEQEQIIEFSYQQEGETLTFVKEDETWYCQTDKTIAIDQDKITSMLDAVVSVKAEERISDYENLSDYGLEEPSQTVKLKLQDQVITLQWGEMNSILGWDYLQKEGEDTVYLVETSIKTTFEKSLADLTVVETTTETEISEEVTEAVTDTEE